MKTESNIKPKLIERYSDLIRLNWAVTESERDGQKLYQYEMKEYKPQEFPADTDGLLASMIAERYSTAEQIRVLTEGNTLPMTLYMQQSKEAAREIMGGAETAETARESKLMDIAVYDASEAVNSYTVNGTKMWTDRSTRSALMRRYEAEKASGKKETTLWNGTIELKMSIGKAIKMLNEVEVYAGKCYDTTAAHKAAVKALTDIDTIKAYDNTTGYPERLSFEI